MTEFALELQDITCTFRSKEDHSQGYTAVGNTTLRIRAGEFVAVVGPTGCGKSTLLNIGAGLLAPSLGSVKVFGQTLDGINKRAGYMFQGSVIATRTSSQAACANVQRWRRCWRSTPTLF